MKKAPIFLERDLCLSGILGRSHPTFQDKARSKILRSFEIDYPSESKIRRRLFYLTVQCALIESLASFRTGHIYKLRTEKGDPSFYYTKSGAMFVDFLHTDPIFPDHFYHFNAAKEKILDQPFNAYEFYDCVRCGLMHEARTKGAWYINASSNDDLLGPFIQQKGDKKKLLRTVRLFARKLDHLFDISPDSRFDWWKDENDDAGTRKSDQ